MCTPHIYHLGGKNPTSTRSRVPRLSPPQILDQPHPMYSLYTPHQPFLSQANNKCVHSISVTWGAKPHFHAISSSPPLTTSNIEPTPPHRPPPPPPCFISLSRVILSTR